MTTLSPRMLVIAPHPDDSVLGAGGIMARFADGGGAVTVLTISAHMPPLFDETVHQATVEEARQAHELIGVAESIFLDRPALSVAQMPHPDLNVAIGRVLARVDPDILVVPYFDRHIDHRAVFDSCMVASRPNTAYAGPSVVAACEILSSTHWNAPHIEPNFCPNWTVDITEFIETKVKMVAMCQSQLKPFPHPRCPEVVRSLSQFRGSQIGVAYGEAFEIIRMTVSPEALSQRRS